MWNYSHLSLYSRSTEHPFLLRFFFLQFVTFPLFINTPMLFYSLFNIIVLYEWLKRIVKSTMAAFFFFLPSNYYFYNAKLMGFPNDFSEKLEYHFNIPNSIEQMNFSRNSLYLQPRDGYTEQWRWHVYWYEYVFYRRVYGKWFFFSCIE